MTARNPAAKAASPPDCAVAIRLDTFLQHYLTLKRGEEVNASHLFTEFREIVEREGRPAGEYVREFREYGDTYRTFFTPDGTARGRRFFQRLEALDTTTVYPLLLELFRQNDKPGGAAEMGQVYVDLESFLLRRLVCRLDTKTYTKFFANVMSRMREADDFSPERLRNLLLAETAEATRWPGDDEFTRAFTSLPIYRRLSRRRVRMILEAIEEQMRSDKSEAIRIDEKLTVEHLMPQRWQANWPLAESNLEAEEAREALLHTVGNLTLLTGKLNPSLSNAPWRTKRPAIAKHSALAMNRRLADAPAWDEAAIRERSRELGHIALRIWPRP